MDFSSLLEQYLARHWRSVSDDILTHLKGFAAHCEDAAREVAERAESAAAAVMSQVADAIVPAAAPAVEAAPDEHDMSDPVLHDGPPDNAAPAVPETDPEPADDQPAAA